MESFGPLLERDIIRVQLEQLETVLLKYLNDDFVMVKTEFDQLSKKGPIKEQGKETFSTRIQFVNYKYRRGLLIIRRYASCCWYCGVEQRLD